MDGLLAIFDEAVKIIIPSDTLVEVWNGEFEGVEYFFGTGEIFKEGDGKYGAGNIF